MLKDQPRVGVAVLIFDNSREEYLLVGKRGASSKRGKGDWSIPGGALEMNETIIQAAARELKEETSLILGEEKAEIVTFTEVQFEGEHWITFYVRGRAKGTPENVEPEKCEGWEFLHYAYLKDIENLFPPFKELVTRKHWYIDAVIPKRRRE